MSVRFFGGVPTKPDVDKLMAKWPDIAPGLIIPYTEIESTIGESVKSNRYLTVVDRWRKTLYRDRNLVLQPHKGVAFEVLQPNGRIDYAHMQFKSGLKRSNKAAHIVATTDQSQIDPSRQGVAAAIGRVHAAYVLANQNKGRQIGSIFDK